MSNKTARAQREATEQPVTPPAATPPADGLPEQQAPTLDPFAGSVADRGRDLVDRLQARHMPTGKDALQPGEIIKRRKLSFDLDGVDCEPDMFVNDAGEYITFKVTLRSLSSADEIASLRGIKDGTAAPMMMCRLALYAINDAVLTPERRDFFWECFGTAGRQICMLAFHELGAASEASMGKYLTSRSSD